MPYACFDWNKPHNNPISGCYDDLSFTGEKGKRGPIPGKRESLDLKPGSLAPRSTLLFLSACSSHIALIRTKESEAALIPGLLLCCFAYRCSHIFVHESDYFLKALVYFHLQHEIKVWEKPCGMEGTSSI